MAAALHTNVASALHRAAIYAHYAPSIHNTQPWRFSIGDADLEVYANPTRGLKVIDPAGRQMLISIGCAILNARVSLVAAGMGTSVALLPPSADPTLVARLRAWPRPNDTLDPLAVYETAITSRQSNRRRFNNDGVPADLVDRLEAAAVSEGALLLEIRDEDQRVTVACLSQRADELELIDPAYRAELRQWTTSDPQRRDGVPSSAVPHVDGTANDEVPIRDFDSRGDGGLPGSTHSSRKQCLLLLGTPADTRLDWLKAGMALERVWLEITAAGYSASLLSQIVEVVSTRAALRDQLRVGWYPQTLLRVGHAPLGPASRRCPVHEVLIERREEACPGE